MPKILELDIRNGKNLVNNAHIPPPNPTDNSLMKG